MEDISVAEKRALLKTALNFHVNGNVYIKRWLACLTPLEITDQLEIALLSHQIAERVDRLVDMLVEQIP